MLTSAIRNIDRLLCFEKWLQQVILEENQAKVFTNINKEYVYEYLARTPG